MKKIATTVFVFIPLMVVSMVLALPLSSESNLELISRQVVSGKLIAPNTTGAPHGHGIIEGSHDETLPAPSPITSIPKPRQIPDSTTATILLLGTGIVGLTGIRRRKS